MTKAAPSKKRSNTKAVSRLRVLLKEKLGLQHNPFQADWTPHFKIIDKRHLADSRAKEGVKHVSFDENHHTGGEYPYDPVDDDDPAFEWL